MSGGHINQHTNQSSMLEVGLSHARPKRANSVIHESIKEAFPG